MFWGTHTSVNLSAVELKDFVFKLDLAARRVDVDKEDCLEPAK